MDPRARAVKQKRSYDASRRQERARENRNKIIDAAERRFLRDGYGPTTIAAIADDAGVHADTVYKGFGGKPGLVRAIRTRALQGKARCPPSSDRTTFRREPDGRRIIEGWGALTVEVAPASRPSSCSYERRRRATRGRALLEEMDADRLRRMTANARDSRRRPPPSRRHGRALTCCGRTAHPSSTSCSSSGEAGLPPGSVASSPTR
jgi:AcrR family transcriptional regulator